MRNDERKSLNEKIDSIVERWGSLLPALLGHTIWKQFKKAGLQNCVISLLKHSTMSWAREFLLNMKGIVLGWKDQWYGEIEVNRDFKPDLFLEIIAQTLIFNPFGRGRIDYLGCGINDCGKPHSRGCLIECDKILGLSPELLKVSQEIARE